MAANFLIYDLSTYSHVEVESVAIDLSNPDSIAINVEDSFGNPSIMSPSDFQRVYPHAADAIVRDIRANDASAFFNEKFGNIEKQSLQENLEEIFFEGRNGTEVSPNFKGEIKLEFDGSLKPPPGRPSM